jgi:hypothetical protein
MITDDNLTEEESQTVEEGTSEADQQAVDEAADNLMKNSQEVRFKVGWFGTTKQADREHKTRMAEEVGATQDSVGISKRLFKSNAPEIKAANEARTALYSHFHQNTIPLAAVKPEGVNDNGELVKEPGSRVIQNSCIGEFDQQQALLIDLMYQKIDALQGQLGVIKTEDSERLGELYNEDDYPDDIRDCVRVTKAYRSLDLSIDLASLAPAVYQRELQKILTQCGDTAQLATAQIAETIMKSAQVIMKQLGNRVRLNPRPEALILGEQAAYLQDAEVVEERTHTTDPDEVMPGYVEVQVRYQKAGASRKTIEWLPPLTAEQYQSLGPFSSDEQKKIHLSSLEQLVDNFQWFRNMADTLVDGDQIRDAISQFNQLLATAGTNSGQVATEMRNSQYFRAAARSGASEMVAALGDVVTSVKKRRRSIVRKQAE